MDLSDLGQFKKQSDQIPIQELEIIGCEPDYCVAELKVCKLN